MSRLNTNDYCREPWQLQVFTVSCWTWGLGRTTTWPSWTPALIQTAPTQVIIWAQISSQSYGCVLWVCVGASVTADSCPLLRSPFFFMPPRFTSDSAAWCKPRPDSADGDCCISFKTPEHYRAWQDQEDDERKLLLLKQKVSGVQVCRLVPSLNERHKKDISSDCKVLSWKTEWSLSFDSSEPKVANFTSRHKQFCYVRFQVSVFPLLPSKPKFVSHHIKQIREARHFLFAWAILSMKKRKRHTHHIFMCSMILPKCTCSPT